MFGDEALKRFAEYEDVHTVLDVGSGAGEQAKWLRTRGKEVITIALNEPADMVGDFTDMWFGFTSRDGLWACHVLEHQRNVGEFLERCWACLRMEGILAITVPPAKTALVGGHVNLFTARTLIYNMILAGFDCSEARVGFYGYNISVIVRKKLAVLPTLSMDNGDIELLAPFFPFPVAQNDDHPLSAVRW